MAPRGNPNKHQLFQPGQSGNPGGKTKEQRQAEVRAAEIAAKLRLAALEKMEADVVSGADPTSLVTADNLRLFKDSEDRAFGTPKTLAEVEGGLTINIASRDADL